MSRTEMGRDGSAEWSERGREKKKALQRREGWVSQTCHQAVHIPQGLCILFFRSPPPPRLTHHAARTHVSHTQASNPPTHSSSYYGAHSSSSTLPRTGNNVIFLLSYSFFLYVLCINVCSLRHTFFFSSSVSCFPPRLRQQGNMVVLISWL